MENLRLENTHQLERFYKYLNYEISSSLLYAASWFIMTLLPVIVLAAIVFTPYMMYVLFTEKKFGWIITFVILIAIPAIFTLVFYPIITIAVLVPFYFYCFILRLQVKIWLEEKRARNELFIQMVESKRRREAAADLNYLIRK